MSKVRKTPTNIQDTDIMKKSKLLKTGGCIVLILLILFVRNGHIHLPGQIYNTHTEHMKI